MLREDILEGLKLAMSKGESLQNAMLSFYNSGYQKEEIEEAARAFQMQQAGQLLPQTSPAPTANQQSVFQPSQPAQTSVPEKPKGKFQQLIEKIIPFQKTSPGQTKEKESPQKLAVILLGLVLFLLLFALIGVVVFKKDIVSFLTGKIVEIFS